MKRTIAFVSWTRCFVFLVGLLGLLYRRRARGLRTVDGAAMPALLLLLALLSIPAMASALPPDADGDGVPDRSDNCPDDVNPLQEDFDLDEIGDVCDNCPDDVNPLQEDFDLDEIGDVCDPETKLTAPIPQNFGFYGGGCAVSGDIVGVGGSGLQMAWVFEFDGTGWIESQLAVLGYGTGTSMSVSGDTVVVGSLDDHIRVFDRDQGGANNWGEVKKVTVPGGGPCSLANLSRSTETHW